MNYYQVTFRFFHFIRFGEALSLPCLSLQFCQRFHHEVSPYPALKFTSTSGDKKTGEKGYEVRFNANANPNVKTDRGFRLDSTSHFVTFIEGEYSSNYVHFYTKGSFLWISFCSRNTAFRGEVHRVISHPYTPHYMLYVCLLEKHVGHL